MKKDLLSIYELDLADFDVIWKKASRLKKEKNTPLSKEKLWG
jgi:hypothetical protein